MYKKNPHSSSETVAYDPKSEMKVKLLTSKCGPDTSGDDYIQLIFFHWFCFVDIQSSFITRKWLKISKFNKMAGVLWKEKRVSCAITKLSVNQLHFNRAPWTLSLNYWRRTRFSTVLDQNWGLNIQKINIRGFNVCETHQIARFELINFSVINVSGPSAAIFVVNDGSRSIEHNKSESNKLTMWLWYLWWARN